MAWYNKYRPSNFAQASGQILVKKVLQNSVKSVFSPNPKVKHAYLFSGPRGTGKTSLARIFAKSINCTHQNSVSDQGEACGICDVCKNGQIDIIELDAASNTGIDNIRDLIEAANTPPFISRYKVYIIDEVHMLSKAAMNALLKTLEEPPSYIVFLMATTDPEKILSTILSRVTHLKLINHTLSDISKLLLEICQKENQPVEPDAINLIAKMAAGGLRDAINLLETVANYGLENYTETEVAQILGVLPSHRLQELADSFLTPDLSALKANITTFEDLGVDPEILLSQLLDYLLSLNLEKYIDQNHTQSQDPTEYNDLIQILADLLSKNLAVASIKSALILIKIRLGDKKLTFSKPYETATIAPVLAPPTQTQPISPVAILEKQVPVNFSREDQIDNNTPAALIPAKSQKGEMIQSDFMSLVASHLKTDKTAPMKIKMFYEYLQAFQDLDTVYLYPASKIAIMQLKSADVNKWLVGLLRENYGQNFGLKIVLEENGTEFNAIKDLIQKPDKKPLESTKTDKPDYNPNTNASVATKPSIELESKPEAKVLNASLENNSNQDFKLSDFYYLYGPLADGTIPTGMKVLPKENPSRETKPKIDHWQSELDDLELE